MTRTKKAILMTVQENQCLLHVWRFFFLVVESMFGVLMVLTSTKNNIMMLHNEPCQQKILPPHLSNKLTSPPLNSQT